MKELYSILGFTEEESRLQGEEFNKLCKKKFREQSKIWHPDKWSNKSEEERKTAEEKFKEINQANDILSNPQKREMYDLTGSTDGNANMNDDPFSGFNPFGGFNPFAQRVPKGDDIQTTITITMAESYSGVNKDVKFKRSKPCSHCNGTGSADGKPHICPHCNGTGTITHSQVRGNMRFMQQSTCPYCKGTGYNITSPCKHCDGSGVEYYEDIVNVYIPAGIYDGAIIKNEGLGESIPNGENGDLYIRVNIAKSNEYRREDSDIIYTLYIDILEAFNGCEKTVTNIDGKTHDIHIRPLTEDGSIYRIYKEGYPELRNMFGNSKGDFCVLIKYKMPKKLTNDQTELLKKFYEIENKK